MKKIAMMITSITLVAALAIGGTLAWLTAKTDTVTNTFTLGNIQIKLDETTGNTYKMSPGATIKKDPKVTVNAGSEACYLFVKVEEGRDLQSYIEYEVAEGWTALEGNAGVYYRTVNAAAADVDFAVLKDNEVSVKDTVTGMPDNAEVFLKFTAYAIQTDNIDNANTAWNNLNAAPSTPDAGE